MRQPHHIPKAEEVEVTGLVSQETLDSRGAALDISEEDPPKHDSGPVRKVLETSRHYYSTLKLRTVGTRYIPYLFPDSEGDCAKYY